MTHTATHCNTLQHTATHCNTLCNTDDFEAAMTLSGLFSVAQEEEGRGEDATSYSKRRKSNAFGGGMAKKAGGRSRGKAANNYVDSEGEGGGGGGGKGREEGNE